MFVLTEAQGIINLNLYNRVYIEGNNILAAKDKEKKYIVTFDDPDHAKEALKSLFKKIEAGKPAWNGKLFKDKLLNPDKYPVM